MWLNSSLFSSFFLSPSSSSATDSVSICFFRDNWRPDSFYPKIAANVANNFHTLCLLDIKVGPRSTGRDRAEDSGTGCEADLTRLPHASSCPPSQVKEQSFENMAKGLLVYEQPRYMTINQCIDQLLEIEDKLAQRVYTADSRAFGVARLGQANQQIVSGTLKELLAIDFGGPLHSLVLAAPELHEIELAMFEYWHWDKVRRSAEQKVKKLEREAQERVEEEERARKMAEAAKSAPTVLRSTVPKAKAPVKASATAPSHKQEESDDDDGVVMEPLF